MKASPPGVISPLNKLLVKKLFNQWKENLYEINILNNILRDNDIFINGINQIPRKYDTVQHCVFAPTI